MVTALIESTIQYSYCTHRYHLASLRKQGLLEDEEVLAPGSTTFLMKSLLLMKASTFRALIQVGTKAIRVGFSMATVGNTGPQLTCKERQHISKWTLSFGFVRVS